MYSYYVETYYRLHSLLSPWLTPVPYLPLSLPSPPTPEAYCLLPASYYLLYAQLQASYQLLRLLAIRSYFCNMSSTCFIEETMRYCLPPRGHMVSTVIPCVDAWSYIYNHSFAPSLFININPFMLTYRSFICSIISIF